MLRVAKYLMECLLLQVDSVKQYLKVSELNRLSLENSRGSKRNPKILLVE